MVSTERAELLASGWTRGSIVEYSSNAKVINRLLSNELISIISEAAQYGEALIIPLTYDCALINADYTKEPYAHVAVLVPLKQINPQFESGRSPGTLDLSKEQTGQDVDYRLTPIGAVYLKKSTLHQCSLAGRYIGPKALRQILEWVTLRLTKDSFPDKWEELVKGKQRRIKDYFKKPEINQVISAFYVKLDSWDDQDEYIMDVMLVHNLVSSDARKFKTDKESEILDRVKTMFGSIDGIEVRNIGVMHEDQVTLSIVREFKRWYMDGLSYSATPEAPISDHY